MSPSKTNTAHQPRVDVIDMLREQTRQGAVIAGMREDVTEIKSALLGDLKNPGILTKVHSLESKAARSSKTTWYLVTLLMGVAASLVTKLLF